jgi:hypothetical protein
MAVLMLTMMILLAEGDPSSVLAGGAGWVGAGDQVVSFGASGRCFQVRRLMIVSTLLALSPYFAASFVQLILRGTYS